MPPLSHGSGTDGTPRVTGELLSNHTGSTTVGTWQALSGVRPVSIVIVIEGTFDATIRLHVSNAITKPADAEPGSQQGEDLTANELVVNGVNVGRQVDILQRFAWIKASVPVFTSGTVKSVGVIAG